MKDVFGGLGAEFDLGGKKKKSASSSKRGKVGNRKVKLLTRF